MWTQLFSLFLLFASPLYAAPPLVSKIIEKKNWNVLKGVTGGEGDGCRHLATLALVATIIFTLYFIKSLNFSVQMGKKIILSFFGMLCKI